MCSGQWTPLHIATQRDQGGVIKILAEKGGDFRAETVPCGRTAEDLAKALGLQDCQRLIRRTFEERAAKNSLNVVKAVSGMGGAFNS